MLLAAQPEETWPDLIQSLPLTPLTDRTVTDRTAFRRILGDVRAKGWCLVDQEMEVGLVSIATPVYTSGGTLVGAINVGVPSLRMTPEDMVQTVLPRLQDTVATISRALKR